LLLTFGLLSFALAWCAPGGPANAAEEKKAPPAADRWEKAIAAFEAADAKSPPAPGGVVFVGSSSIRLWDLKKSFPDLNAINRGFGGSQLADSVRYADRIVIPYKPRTVVLYAGDNDIAAGKKAEQISRDFAAFVAKVRKALPETKIIYIPVKPSTSRWKYIDEQRKTNRLIRQQCEEGQNLVYLEIEKPMLDDQGNPRGELLLKDGLHMNEQGYAIWNALLKPHLNDQQAGQQ
jgi:lysophospholipase L1-like esterase